MSTGAEAKGNGATLNVAFFGCNKWEIKMWPHFIGWAVKTKPSGRSKGASSYKVILLPEAIRKLQDRKSPILFSPRLELGGSKIEDFKRGRPLISLSTPIRARVGSNRPRLLYRAVHDKQPGNGLRARGFGTTRTDQLSFMLQFHHHLIWNCRDASPFMSTTTSCAKAATVAAWYERNGFSNVEVLVIKVDESKWPTRSKIWHVGRIAARLDLPKRLNSADYDREYLIENFIPESCVTRFRWEEMKADIKAETREVEHFKKRKRSVFESDDPGNETALSSGLGRRVWGVVETSDSKGYLLRNP